MSPPDRSTLLTRGTTGAIRRSLMTPDKDKYKAPIMVYIKRLRQKLLVKLLYADCRILGNGVSSLLSSGKHGSR